MLKRYACVFLLFAAQAQAFEVRAIPDEYEATTAADLAMNNAGYAANDPHAGIRVNPALLAGAKAYSVEAGYHWPTSGREFYQAAVVDSKTSNIAAGVSYTGFTDTYSPEEALKNVDGNVDSTRVRRGIIGFAQAFGNIQAGLGATYIEANKLEADPGDTSRIKGTGVNLGISGALTQELRFGASVENASNRRIADYAPKTIRVGTAYAFSPQVTGYLDYRQRDRVLPIEGPQAEIGKKIAVIDLTKHPEQMVFASLSAQVYDFFRLMGSYGQELSTTRKSLSGGGAVVNKGMSIAYTMSRPYMANQAAHQAVSLGVDMAL